MSLVFRTCALSHYYLGVGILACVLLVGEFYGILKSYIIPYFQESPETMVPSDFILYYDAVFRFIQRQDSLYLEISRDSLWGYLYPPPSILLFFPFSYLGLGMAYLLFVICAYCALLVSLYVWFQYCEEKGMKATYLERAALILVGMAAGPMYHNAVHGQVNSIVLLTCISYIFLLHRGRPAWAGLCLAIGIWIKLYPIMLCILGLNSRAGIKSIVWTLSFGLAAVVILLPWLPIDLYVVYFADLLPRMSGRTIVNIINQSLTAFLMRFVISFEQALSWVQPALVVHAWIRWVNILFLAGSCFGIGLLVWTKKHDKQIAAASCLLAAIPIFSPLGWGHAYVYALPVILTGFHRYASKGREHWFSKGVVLAALLALMIPVYHRFLLAQALPSVLQNLLYSRYLLATLMCSVLQLYSLKMFSSKTGSGCSENEC